MKKGAEAHTIHVDLAAFGEKLRQARNTLNLSQEELSQFLGVKRQTLISWEQGRTSPGVEVLLKLKQAAKQQQKPVDLAALLGEVKRDFGKTPFEFPIDFLKKMETLGIRNAYLNRASALDDFAQVLQSEEDGITIVCSSFLGVLRVASQKVADLLKQKAKTVEFQVMMTHLDLSEWREHQEGRQEEQIYDEIRESAHTLTSDWGIPKECIKLYRGAPTVFMLFTPERMLLNPYSYRSEAYKTFTLEVVKTGNHEDIYTQYFLNHFKRPWDSDSAVPSTEVPELWAPKLKRRETVKSQSSPLRRA
jgi:transcriptional regulator with XRE-family HTH domain